MQKDYAPIIVSRKKRRVPPLAIMNGLTNQNVEPPIISVTYREFSVYLDGKQMEISRLSAWLACIMNLLVSRKSVIVPVGAAYGGIFAVFPEGEPVSSV